MTEEARSGGRRWAARLADPAVAWGATLACVAVGMLLQASLPLGHDLGWLYFASLRWLAGAEVYGRDLIEWNQPANLYLLAPAAIIESVAGLSAIAALRAWLALLLTAGLAAFAAALHALLGPRRVRAAAALVTFAAFLSFVQVGASFGQREHLVAAFFLPWLGVVAARITGSLVPLHTILAAAIACAIAICLKPQYVLVALALEAILQVHRPGRAMLLRADPWLVAAFGAAYCASLFLVTPGYPTLVLPLALDTYWVYQAHLVNVATPQDGVLLAAVLAAGFGVRLRCGARHAFTALAEVFGVSAIAFLGVAIAQRTGWRYHFLPFQVASALQLALCALVWLAPLPSVRSAVPVRFALGVASAALGAAILLFAPGPHARTFAEGARWRAGETPGLVGQLTDALRTHAPDGTVFVVSPSLVNVFPAVLHADVGWTSRFAGFYLPAAVTRARRGDPEAPARLTPARADAIEAYVREAIIDDMERRPPDLVLIDTVRRRKVFAGVPFDFLAYMLEDPRFAEAWSDYEPIGRVGRFEAAVRRRP